MTMRLRIVILRFRFGVMYVERLGAAVKNNQHERQMHARLCGRILVYLAGKVVDNQHTFHILNEWFAAVSLEHHLPEFFPMRFLGGGHAFPQVDPTTCMLVATIEILLVDEVWIVTPFLGSHTILL